MNDRPPSGSPTPTASADDAFAYGDFGSPGHGYDTSAFAGGTAEDPLHPSHVTYDTGAYATGGYEAGGYPTPAPAGSWDTGAHAHATTGYDAYGYGTDQWSTADSGGYDVSALWSSGPGDGFTDTPAAGIPRQAGPADDLDYGYPSASAPTAQWDASGQWSSWDLNSQYDSAVADWSTGQYDTTAYFDTAHDPAYDTTYETAYDSAADPGGAPGPAATAAWDFGALAEQGAPEAPTAHDAHTPHEAYAPADAPAGEHGDPQPDSDDRGDGCDAPTAFADGPAAIPSPRTRAGRPSRRRCPKRSALLTVAVPSIAVVGVAGVAAATVTGSAGSDEDKSTQAAPDVGAVQKSSANTQLDTQLEGLTRDADEFADRASRTQERIDLKEKQEAERKRKAAEAARREALRPKFAVPVSNHGLSAYYGQAGVNWMSVHTGIDFPVSYGSEVMAATDGTVTTRYDYSYGNMLIVTAADGTETWYAHLDSYRISSGPVQAGDVIGYSGNSGNSTGPHLHFEVHPYGGDAVDPLAWLQSKGLDPR